MAISNLLSLNGNLKPTQSSLAMRTTTPSGVPSPLTFPPQTAQPTQPTSGLLGTSTPTNTSTNSSLVSTSPSAQTSSFMPVSTSPQVASAAPVSGLFQNVVSSLANRGTTPNQTATDYTKQIADYGAQNASTGQQAIDIAKQFGQQYADVGQAGARFRAGQLTTGTSPVAEGNAAVTAQTTAAQQQALAQGEQAALQGIGYQQAGFTNAASAANQAAGQSYAGQGLQQNALGAAAGFASPQIAQPGQAFYNPVEQNTVGGLSPEIMQQYAQMAANGQLAGVPSSITSNPVLNAQLNAAAKALNPNYNPVTSGAQSGIISAQEQQAQAYQSALNQGQALQSQLNDLISAFGLNPNDLNAANIGIQAIARNTSDTRYKALQNYINDIANTYSQILTPPGGTSTDTTRNIAASMLDATASGKSIQDLMRVLDQQANAKIANVRTISPSGSSSSGGSSGWY